MRSPTTGKAFAQATPHGPRWTGKAELIPKMLDVPLRWKKPRRIFVNSMSDLFHESLPDEAIDQVFAVMALSPWHTYQVLTKRPERMRAYMLERWQPAAAQTFKVDEIQVDMPAETEGEDRQDQVLMAAEKILAGPLGDQDRFWTKDERHLSHVQPWPLPNVWLGTSVEDQATADARIPLLLQTPAAKRFVSYEPALAGVDFTGWFYRCDCDCSRPEEPHDEPILDWVIVGGESGPGARPFDVAWARSTVRQCKAAGVACFYKQGGASNRCVHNSKGGHFECFPPDLQIREFPDAS
jgi:protein gp37